MLRYLAWAALAGTVLAAWNTTAQTPVPVLPECRYRPVVIAHRGDHTRVPENTLAAYREAIRGGADYVEVDLRTTRDGRLVIMHNETVDQTTNGRGRVADLSFADIRRLKVLDKRRPGEGKSIYRVPSFEEVLALCRDKIHIYLDFKQAAAGKAYAAIKAAGMERSVIVYINEREQFDDWREAAPEVPLIASLPDEVDDRESMRRFLDAYPVKALDGSPGRYGEGMRQLAAERGVAIWLDIQRGEEDGSYWETILEEDVDGMQSDHPGALVRYLREKGLR